VCAASRGARRTISTATSSAVGRQHHTHTSGGAIKFRMGERKTGRADDGLGGADSWRRICRNAVVCSCAFSTNINKASQRGVIGRVERPVHDTAAAPAERHTVKSTRMSGNRECAA
ncbi:hypothetical protein LTR16_011069, partial [Cryomyces antarcticus]